MASSNSGWVSPSWSINQHDCSGPKATATPRGRCQQGSNPQHKCHWLMSRCCCQPVSPKIFFYQRAINLFQIAAACRHARWVSAQRCTSSIQSHGWSTDQPRGFRSSWPAFRVKLMGIVWISWAWLGGDSTKQAAERGTPHAGTSHHYGVSA
jgi:hypothetical protein